jgi:tyrosyl-tRNA synthetase
MASDVYQEFEWRGMVHEGTEGVRDLLAREQVTCYIGFDPTAASLHVGSLLPLLALARMQRFGHSPIAIAGGGTGMVGDPSGKTQERQLLGLGQIAENLKGIRAQLERFLDFDRQPNPARIVNNADWLGTLNLMEFLRDVGKHFTVNGMLARESVRRRLESEDGISYTEFTYSLLQAYDFLVLFDRYRCTLQLGGSDQWGNIVSGADLIRKLRGARAHGLVMPLVTTASGVKFGKTEAGAVWLDPALTSDFGFYQFWLNTDDRDAVKYLKFFTFFDQARVTALAAELEAAPEKRVAQRELAREVTRLVRGEEAVGRAERASAILFGGSLADAKADDVLEVFADVPSTEIEASRFEGPGLAIADLVALTGLTSSKGEAARAIKGGGIYVNDARVADERGRVTLAQAIDGRLFVLRKGQRNRHVVRLRQDG